eukprot:397139-Prymnesium_polylepis.1
MSLARAPLEARYSDGGVADGAPRRVPSPGCAKGRGSPRWQVCAHASLLVFLVCGLARARCERDAQGSSEH